MADIDEVVAKYLSYFPSEKDRLQRLTDFLTTTDGDHRISRKNFVGHLTGSAVIVDLPRKTVLLVHHKFLDRWLQPGGHIDIGETVLNAAIREAEEETGVSRNDLSLVFPDNAGGPMPLDIDSHFIPANISKNEAEHWHHDFRYLFIYTGKSPLTVNENETKGHQWMAIEQLPADDDLSPLLEKATYALSVLKP